MSATPMIVCSQCHKQYKWKAELAGRKVKCKCGQLITVSAAPPEQDEEIDLYAFADDATSGATPATPIQPIAPIAPIAATAAPAAVVGAAHPMLGYRPKPISREPVSSGAWGLEGSPIKDFWLPIACIAVGLIVKLVDWMVLNDLSFIWAMSAVGIEMVVEMTILVIGCLIAMRLLDMALGAPLQALLKLAGVAIAPGAIGGLIASSFDFGWMIGWGIAFLMYIFLLMAFFDLDGNEVMILAVIIWVLRQAAAYAVLFLLMSWVATGTPGIGAIGGAGGGGGGSGSYVATSAEIDADARMFLADDPHQEARQWLGGSPQRLLEGLSRQQTVELVEALYAAGAGDVQASGIDDDYPGADMLIVTLPKAKAARSRIFVIEGKYLGQVGDFEPTPDVGQTYLIMYIDE